MIAAGGTGGHVYPALAVAEALVKKYPDVRLSFVGSGGLERELVGESQLPFTNYADVMAGPLAGVGLVQRLISMAQYVIGTLQALILLLRWRPSVLLLTGGWSGLPVALAATVLRVPSLVFLPDIEPGATIRILRRLVTRAALSVSDSEVYFPHTPTVVTGYPLREAFLQADRAAGLAHFGLDAGRKTLLVFGGSRGARSINRAVIDNVPALLASGLQIIHVTGTLDWPEIETRREALDDATHYHAFPYLHHDMALAQAAADLVVSRAGASTLAEFPYFGLASVLVPYPHAWRYQKVNADYLVKAGAAVRLDDERLTTDLLPTITSLMTEPAQLAHMQAQARSLARGDGAQRLAQELVKLAGRKGA